MKKSFWFTYVALGFSLLVLSGCEEDVVAVLNAEVPFSMYGVLNPLEDTQYVRVFPIEGTLVPEDPASLEARFTSTHQRTGGSQGLAGYPDPDPGWDSQQCLL